MAEQVTNVFSRPNFEDPTLFQRKHEVGTCSKKYRSRDHLKIKVFGYFHQKWSSGDYGDFDPRTNPRCILPQAAAKLNDPGDFMRYLMVENCAFKVDGWLTFFWPIRIKRNN